MCPFYASLSVAIAWNVGSPDKEPAERFTNPISLGISTVGYARQASIAEYGGEFVCASATCVHKLVDRIHAGGLRREFDAYRIRVAHDASWNMTRRRYERLFRALYELEADQGNQSYARSLDHTAALRRRRIMTEHRVANHTAFRGRAAAPAASGAHAGTRYM